MKENIKNMLGYNLKTLLGFEAIYKLSTTIVFVPLFLAIFQMITRISGHSYLTFENVFSFLLNPLTIIFLFMLIILLTFYALIDISTIIIILDSSYQKKKITIREAFGISLKKAKQVFQKKNILFPFLVLFLIPFLNMGISSSFISTISIPEFILDYISHNSLLSILYFIIIILLAGTLFRWLYVLHYFVLEDCNFKEASRRSTHLSHKNKIKDFASIIGVQLVMTIFYFLFVMLGIFIIMVLYKLFGGMNLFSDLSITIIWLLIAISFLGITLLSTPISYAIITALYYYRKKKLKEKIVHITVSNKEKKLVRKRLTFLPYIVCPLVLISGTIFTYNVANGKYNLKIEYVRTMEVTAHRGASLNYPENTMSAFRGAKELGADWIELDVQQTKDRKLIVLHDTNLKRTTGVDKNTWELTLEEVEKLDAGSFFSPEFAGEKIPLLEDVIVFAKENNMKLNIELKPTGKEIEFEKDVVDLVRKYDFVDNCVITSQVYEVLENVKKYNREIQTVYVMSLAYGDITKLTAADSFSIEASSATKKLVNKVHNEGKELYVWTVNTKENIQKMIDLNVDNIITDNITLAKDTIYSSKTSDVIQEYIKWVNKVVK